MKNYFTFFIALIILSTSCTKVSNNGIPSYIKLNKPSINITDASQGSAVHDFSELWLETDGINLGAYEYPTTFAVLLKGKKQIIINPGVRYNENETSRRIYPVFEPFSYTYNFVLKDTIEINPVFKYRSKVKILNNEDFESTNNFNNLDRTNIDDDENIDGKSGVLTLFANDKEKEALTVNPIEIPSGKSIYVEFGLKTDCYVEIGIRSVKFPTNFKSLAIFKPSEQWHTSYFDISSFINKVKEGEYNFYINAEKLNSGTEEKVYFDNFKIIQF